MRVQILALPYDSGARALRMGVGPLHLMDRGLAACLRQAGHEVEEDILETPTPPLTPEPRIAFELNRQLASELDRARQHGLFPIVLAGSCYSAIGTVASLGSTRTGVVWFDSHADFNTPETTITGFLDGMSLAVLTGRCWTELAGTVPGFEPLPDTQAVLVGARDIDPLEGQLLERSAVTLIAPDQLPAQLGPSLQSLSESVDQTYVHIDLDVLDPSEGRANWLAAPGGLTLSELIEAVRTIGRHSPIAAVSLTAYDPSHDREDKILGAAITVLDTVLQIVAQQGSESA